MRGYVAKALQRFEHDKPVRRQLSPSKYAPPNYRAKVQYADGPDTADPIGKSQRKCLQEVIGVFLFYARAVDNTMLHALSCLSKAQAKGTQATMEAMTHLLNYAATNPDATVRFHASNMVLNIHSDASHLSEPRSQFHVGG